MRNQGGALGSKSSCFLLVLGLVLLGSASEISAASLDKKSTADAKKATELYRQGSYEDAAALFLQLSLDNPGMPVFVRNLGACYYYLRRPEPALSNLREYLLKKKDLDPQDQQEVERWIKEMDELRRGGANPQAAKPPTDSPAVQPEPGVWAAPSTAPPGTPGPGLAPYQPYQPMPPPGYAAPPPSGPWTPPAPSMGAGPNQTPGAQPAAAAAPEASTVSAVATQPEEPSKSSGRMTAAWVLGGVGAAAIITGGICSLMAASRFSDVEKKYDPGKESDGKIFAAVQWIGYGVGAAAVTTAVILALTGGHSSGPVALAPVVGPGQAGAAVGGSF
jgi:hypothetical protein